MKYGDLNLGQIEAIVNKLGGMDGVKGLLSGALVVVNAVTEKFLELVGTIMVPATKKFVATDHFTVDVSAKAEVRIGYLSDSFRNWFLGKTEEPRGTTELNYQRLRKYSPDKPILDELGDTAETTLGMVWELLRLQPNGEDGGTMLTNGCANIFYVRDVNGELRTVCACLSADDGWYVSAHSVAGSHGQHAGHRVFSRLPD